MAEDDVLGRIQELADEEHELYERHHGGDPLTENEHRRLASLEANLDQCWDLLRQRRSRREFGENPSTAQVRDESTVEGYRQ
jgi:hypothetical protein